MRIYVAAPWINKSEARAAAETLEKKGHTITEKWWEHPEVDGYLRANCNDNDREELAYQAAQDVTGVLSADAFVLLNLGKSEGKSVETGIAIISEVPRLILIGGKSNLFHYLGPWEEFNSIEQAAEVL